MSFAARQHGPAVQSGLPALGSIVVEDYTLPDTVEISFNSNGTISTPDYLIAGPATWYGSTVTGIGSSYEIRFVLNSGTAWTAGLVSGTWYSLSTARALAMTSSTEVSNNITVSIRETATGAIVTTGTLSMYLWLEP